MNQKTKIIWKIKNRQFFWKINIDRLFSKMDFKTKHLPSN